MSLTKNIGIGKEVFNPFRHVGDDWYEQLVKYDMVPTKEDLGVKEMKMRHSKSGKYLFLFIDADNRGAINCTFDTVEEFITVDTSLYNYLERLKKMCPDAYYIDSFIYLKWRLSYKKGT